MKTHPGDDESKILLMLLILLFVGSILWYFYIVAINKVPDACEYQSVYGVNSVCYEEQP